MNKLSKEKRNQLILTLMIIVAGVVGLYFGLINFQREYLTSLERKKSETSDKLNMVVKAIKNLDQKEAELKVASTKLKELESQMAYGDVYSWLLNLIRQFKLSYRVDIPSFSQQAEIKEVNLLPKFPYQQAALTIGGTAYYHDLGRFIADFENQYPYFRVLNLRLEPVSAQSSGEQEKLSFSLEIIALVKPEGA